MNLISTRIHGVLDYLVGFILIIAPWLIGFDDVRSAMLVPVILGAGAILYSLLTNYELGVVRIIPMSGHLTLDILSGLFLIASPWLFQFDDYIIWPHVTFGILEVAAALMTSRVPSVSHDDHHHHPHTPAHV